MLTQVVGGQERIVQHLCRKLIPAETIYPATDKEWLAVVWAVRECRHYIWDQQFSVVTVCSALRWLLKAPSPCSRLTRYALQPYEYTFTVKYRKGILNNNADALPRLFSDKPASEREPSVPTLPVSSTSFPAVYGYQWDPLISVARDATVFDVKGDELVRERDHWWSFRA